MRTGFSNEQLVMMYRESNGDERYIQELITQNVGLMNKLAINYASSIPHAEVEDLVSEEYFPLMKAINNYDESKEIAFTTFFKVCVQQHFNKMYTHETVKKRFTGTQDSYEGLLEKASEDGYGALGKSFTVECSEYLSIEFSHFLRSLKLDDKDKVIVNVIMRGGSKMDASKILDIKPSSVTSRIKKIRKLFVNAGYAF